MSKQTPNTTNYTRVEIDDSGTGTSTAGAATLNTQTGFITTEALSTAAGASYTFTLTSTLVKAGTIPFWTVGKGTATTGGLVPIFSTSTAGSNVTIFQNVNAAAVNGTVTLGYFLTNMA